MLNILEKYYPYLATLGVISTLFVLGRKNSSKIIVRILEKYLKLEQSVNPAMEKGLQAISELSKSIDKMNSLLVEIKIASGKVYLSEANSLELLERILENLINTKLSLFRKILIEDTDSERIDIVIDNIKIEFERHTLDTVNFLSKFNCCVDLAEIVNSSFDYNIYVNVEIRKILSSKSGIESKMIDARTLERGYVTKIIHKFKTNL